MVLRRAEQDSVTGKPLALLAAIARSQALRRVCEANPISATFSLPEKPLAGSYPNCGRR